jgi:hypothetical protein
MGEVGDRTQGFRRMAASNKPAGIRSLVYGIGKGKGGIEGFRRVLAPLIWGVDLSPPLVVPQRWSYLARLENPENWSMNSL